MVLNIIYILDEPAITSQI